MGKYPFENPDLPLEDRVEDLILRLTLEEKISLLPTQQAAVERLGIREYSVGGEAAHGVAWVGEATVFPQPIGLACTWDKDLLYKIGDVIGTEARAYYKKLGSKGGLTLWAPTVDMARDPRWGRTEEAYGEDPCLTGELTTQLINGMQGDHPFYLKMGATLKHFFANNNEYNRGTSSASIDPRNMKEYYWNAFKPSIVNAKTCCIMTAYNAVNGTPCIVDPILNDIVKGEWGLPGFIVTDAADFSQTVTMHGYYSSYYETAAAALKNGVDCITDEPELVIESVRGALSNGLLEEVDIDNALRNIFRVRFRLGQFDPESCNPYAGISEEDICRPEHRRLSREAAKKSVVLLKNEEGVLPLNRDNINSIAVIGPLGDVVYTDWYSGTLPYKITPFKGIGKKTDNKAITFTEGCDCIALKSLDNDRYISVRGGSDNVLRAEGSTIGINEMFDVTDWGWGNFTLKSYVNGKFVNGAESLTASKEEVRSWFVEESFNMISKGDDIYIIKIWDGKYITVNKEDGTLLAVESEESASRFKLELLSDGIKNAVASAQGADVSIVFVGNNPYINGKENYDRPDIILPPAQEKLIEAVYAANPNTVMVVVGSYPFAINWADKNIPAILYTSHAGQEIGSALADIIFGDYSPAGRLNMTWYKSMDQLPPITDYDIIKGNRTYMYFDGDILYPFGHGLTYTDFKYSNLKIDVENSEQDKDIKITFYIENIGKRASDEVVQLYVSADNSRVKRPLKELKCFERIHLDVGESKRMDFTLSSKELAFWDVTREKFCIESGFYHIMIGSSSKDIRLDKIIKIEGEKIPPRDLTYRTKALNYDDYSFGHIALGEGEENKTCVIAKDKESWIAFNDVQFSKRIDAFEVRAFAYTKGDLLEVRIDDPYGEIIAKCYTEDEEKVHSWETFSCKITQTIEGNHNLYIRFTTPLRLNWFRFF
ncbi:MAG: glycoside hydrolase family 3 protein [Xylanivirga thermophila]|jgi:beta-glucosidase|uniref:glycoside hydrolase family 3 protein n=1 Tax=Xylanivirga thermophila TaxID=2496273 RepID=UPI00101B5B92|nr:glycoside hydrolase family 3 protein [Xylanivirga thermophila]